LQLSYGVTMSYILDFAPRRIWLGLTIPGKKMMRLLGEDGRDLLYVYKNDKHVAIITVAKAIHEIPTYGAEFGPRAADLRKPLAPYNIYGAILTDIRDFLKLRFRAVGFTLKDLADLGVAIESLQAGQLPETNQTHSAEEVLSQALHFVIASLDDLSTNPSRDIEQIDEQLLLLRGLLVDAYRLFYPTTPQFLNSLFGDAYTNQTHNSYRPRRSKRRRLS